MADILNTNNETFYEFPNWLLLLGTKQADALAPEGEPEGVEEENPNPDQLNDINGLEIGLVAKRVVKSAGGQQMDYADLDWVLKGHLVDRDQPAQFAQSMQIFVPDTQPNPNDINQLDENTRVFWGEYVQEAESCGEDGESLTAQAQVRPYHYGKPFEGQVWHDPTAGENVTTGFGPVFNPRIDGQILPNMGELTFSDSTAKIWMPPEGARTSSAEDVALQGPELWTLKEAVRSMVQACYVAEQPVQIISDTELNRLDNAPDLLNISLPAGKYLPYYLDALLQPLGYNWCLDHDQLHDYGPTIRIIKRGVGDEVTVKLQRPGETLSVADTQAEQYAIARRIGDSPNAVRIEGALQRREVTFPLWPAWAESDDALAVSALKKQDGSSYAAHQHAHRKWVAGESGDYYDLRSDDLTADVPSFDDVFDVWVPHRMKAEEPLTYLADGTTDPHGHPILVEYSTDAGTSWAPITDEIAGNMLLLPDELGILFNSDEPPEDLRDSGGETIDDIRLRMTCTLTGCSRIVGEAERQGTAVNSRDNKLTLQMAERFLDQQVVKSGTYASQLYSGAAGAEEQDDSTEIQTYAETLRDQYETAEIACTIRLAGFHDYKIGDLITKVEGREIGLNEASAEGTARYPQITQIVETLEGGPHTELRCDRGVRLAAIPKTGKGYRTGGEA